MLTQYQMLEMVKAIDKALVPKVLGIIVEDEEKGETNKEYEQRWKLKKLPDGLSDPSEIRQGFLFEKPGFNLRIREEKKGAEADYTLTCKFYVKSDEAEVAITKEMFDKLWAETTTDSRMEKTRYRHGDWEIDDIRSPASKKGVVAEIETATKGKKIEPPKEWEVEKKFVYT